MREGADTATTGTNTGTEDISPDIMPRRAIILRELMAYILSEHPRSKNFQLDILNAVKAARAGNTKKLQSFEKKYAFRYVGEVNGEPRFVLI